MLKITKSALLPTRDAVPGKLRLKRFSFTKNAIRHVNEQERYVSLLQTARANAADIEV